MNNRMLAIVRELSGPRTSFTIDGLAERHQVSSRTIRNDLDAINESLEEHGLPPVTLARGGLIQVPESFSELLAEIDPGDYYQYKLSPEERKRVVAAMLVGAADFLTLSSIADTLYVSRATIIHDLDDIKALVAKGGLEVQSYPNKGLRVLGAESAKRDFLLKLVREQGREQMVGDPTKIISLQAGNKIVIQKIVNEQEKVYDRQLTDQSFVNIVQYLGVLVNRNLQGAYIEPQSGNNPDTYLMALSILKFVCQYCNVQTTEDEIAYFSYVLADAKTIHTAGSAGDTLRIQMLTRQLISRLSEELGVDLTDDYDFYENLSNHLISVAAVDQLDITLSPIVEEVIEEHPDVQEAIEKQSHLLEQCEGRSLSRVEIGCIVLHVCAALERKKNKEIAFHVVVACHAGIGTSQLLLERLKKNFNFRIVDIISAHGASEVTPEQADLIISTVPLSGCAVETVTVSPLLSDEDYLRIGTKIDTLRNSRHLPTRIEEKGITANGLMERLVPLIHEIAPEQEKPLVRAIRKEVRHYLRQSVESEAEIFAPYLHHLLTVDHIQLDVECQDWKEAIAASAQPLLEGKYIESNYIEAMIQNTLDNGPYYLLSPGFAMPHAGLEEGSVKVGMNLIRLKEPVVFDDEEDPVEFVCCLSAIDHRTHLKAFFNLVNLLQKEGFKDQLRQCRTPEEMTSVIEHMEYTLT